mmetsp:Transcript_53650/g.64702  ORF Transcript_53650/g.64702 Transcript_53650/m.64702 type:complete len:229 (-) Transcript_53650:308-994(-)
MPHILQITITATVTILLSSSINAFTSSSLFSNKHHPCFILQQRRHDKIPFERQHLQMSSPSIENKNNDDDEEDEDEVEPGQMRVSEIKAELDMRGVKYDDCFDKDSLVVRLKSARSGGKADPSILENFNKQRLEANFKGEEVTPPNPSDFESVVGGDGNLPGGMSPEMLQKLMGNPELMVLLQSPKMQDVMKLMMTDGKEALEKAIAEDEEVREIVTKLNEVMGTAMQ